MDVPATAVTGTTGVFASERVFDLAELGEPLGMLPRGVLIRRIGRLAIHPRSGGSGERVIAVCDQQHLVHVPLPHEPLIAAGLAAVLRNRTLGVALHPGGDADLARLALEFAAHLDNRRRRDAHPVRPCVTSVTAPDLSSTGGLIRLPHLLTVRDDIGGLSDAVVWELMTLAQARRWLGGPFPRRLQFERQLPALLHLRFLARTGQLPGTADGELLRELLTERYLSIRLVYRHPDLFAVLLPAVSPPLALAGDDD